MAKADRQVLEFINPGVDSDDEDDNIFEPERSCSGVFNTFVNKGCVKKYKNVLSSQLGSMLFPKFLKCWKFTHTKIQFLRLPRN